jgi:pimeloyl-ACP methyl ester carboxylesterase
MTTDTRTGPRPLGVEGLPGVEATRARYLSRGAQFALELTQLAPERVVGAAFIGPMFPYTPSQWSLLLHPRLAARFRRPATPCR